MPTGKRDMREALKNRVALTDRPQIAETPGERIMPGAKLVRITRLVANPTQPRKRFDAGALDELAASIRERGILQPLSVRPHDEGYSIIMGERRYRAAVLAGLDEVPVIVRDTSDEQTFLDALIENLHRANLTDEEEGEAYKGLLGQGYSVRRIADSLGIAASKVSRVVRIYEDPVLAEAVIDEQITKSDAQELLGVPDDDKPRLVQFIAGRRKQKAPLSRDELREHIGQARQSVAQRNTLGPGESTNGTQDQQSVAQRNTLDKAALTVPPALTLAQARQQARTLRRTVEESLAALGDLITDARIAADLVAIGRAVDQVGRRAQS